MARRNGRFTLWMVLATLVFAGFIVLGNWQVRRLGWKLNLIHDVSTRVHAPPVSTPGPDQWARIRHGDLHYLHVRLHGHFLAGRQTLVHGASSLGYGYWVMAPLVTTRGFIVLVNRGYIPSRDPNGPLPAKFRPPQGEVTLTGLLRFTQSGGGFMRPNRLQQNQWYSRDVAAIAKANNLSSTRVAPYFVDAGVDTTRAGGPVAGLTKVHFRNAHLGYAITWYLLALGTALGAGIIVRHHLRTRRGQSTR